MDKTPALKNDAFQASASSCESHEIFRRLFFNNAFVEKITKFARTYALKN
jgi:hypothetical protein